MHNSTNGTHAGRNGAGRFAPGNPGGPGRPDERPNGITC